MPPEQPRPRKGLLAIRASSAKQGFDGDSPDAQDEQGIRYAEQKNITIVKTLTYLESASKEQQPMQNVIDYCVKHKDEIDVVIVKSIDRFTRGGAYFYESLKMQLDPLNIDLEDIYGVINNTKVNTLEHLGIKYRWSVYTPSRKSELLEAERAKDELRDIMSRMIGAEVRYTRLGYWMRSSPYGYLSKRTETTNGKRYILLPEPSEAVFVQKMFDLRIQGTLSDTQIVDKINKMGYISRYFNRRGFADKTLVSARLGGNKLTLKRFWIYIANPIYAGVIYEKWTEDQPVKAQFDGLVSFKKFNAANRGKVMLSEKNGVVTLTKLESPDFQRQKGTHDAEYPYRKVVTCSTCELPLYGSAAKGRYKYYPGYHCNKRGHHFRVPKEKLEAAVEEFVHQITFTQDHIDNVMEAIETVWNKRQQEVNKDEIVIDNRMNELKAQALATVDKIKLLSSATAIKYLEEELMKIEEQMKVLASEKEQKVDKQPVSFDLVLKYARYFLEHMDYLLLQQIDPIKKADFFGVLFNKTPSYAEILSVTAEGTPLTGLNELFKLKNDDVSSLVRVRGL